MGYLLCLVVYGRIAKGWISRETSPAQGKISRQGVDGGVSGRVSAAQGEIFQLSGNTKSMVMTTMVMQLPGRNKFRLGCRAEDEDFTALIWDAGNPIFVAAVLPDGNMHLERLNAAAEALVGQLRERTGAWPQTAAGEVEARLAQCRQERQPITFVTRPVLAGEERTLVVTLTPQIAGGRVERILGTAQDITGQLPAVQAGLSGEAKFRLLFEQTEAGISLHRLTGEDRVGPFEEVNAYLCEVLGFTRDELLRKNPSDLLAPGSTLDLGAIRQEILTAGHSAFVFNGRSKDGRTVPLEVAAHIIHLNQAPYILAVASDSSERLRVQHTLERRLELERAVARVGRLLNSGEAVDLGAVLGILGRATAVSRVYTYRFRDGGKSLDKTAEWCADGVESKMAETQGLSARALPWLSGEIFNHRPVIVPDIADMPPEAVGERALLGSLGVRSLLCVPSATPNAEATGFLGLADTIAVRDWLPEDVELMQAVSEMIWAYQEREQIQDRIRYLSFHDKLTGLYNKAFLEEEMSRLDTPRQLPLSLIMGDVNGLKFVNDAFGHLEGDQLLVRAAAIMRKSCRREDIVARWGGDEFVILLPQTDLAGAREVERRIRQGMEAAEGEATGLSIALGLAVKSRPGETSERLLKEAEDRMYRDKLLLGSNARRNLARAMEKNLLPRSCETEAHTRRLQALALALGRAAGLADSELTDLGLLGLLHDIGKIGVPADIWTKPGPLSAEEWAIVKRHPEIGYRIASAAPELAHIAYGILTHHERWDGGGYPRGLSGTAIPRAARMVAIADAYTAMTEGRPYRKRRAAAAALSEIEREAGRQFDPELVGLFAAVAAGEEGEQQG